MLTWEQLVRDTLTLAGKLPADTAGIIGIARKGMVPAAILAERLHVPLGELGTFIRGPGFFEPGKRKPLHTPLGGPFVVVDDSVRPGAPSLRKAMERIRKAFPAETFYSAVPWIPAGFDPVPVDFFGRQVQLNDFQEMEFLNTFSAVNYAIDMDGVLCEDPPAPETDDEELWTNIFAAARPLYLPRLVPVGAIISARMEKYRTVTEAWLTRYGVKYRELILSPARTVAEREGALVRYGGWKGLLFRDRPERVFIESDPHQAAEIAALSGKPCFCTATKQFANPAAIRNPAGIRVRRPGIPVATRTAPPSQSAAPPSPT
jgi:uncharacterized HAD superfamily protein